MQVRSHNHVRRNRRAAFTLMEVLVVVAILVVLAGIGIGVYRYLDDSKEKIALAGTKNIETAVVQYQLSNQDWPESLAILTVPTEGKAAYLEQKALYDPWNRPYVYDPTQLSPTGKPLIYSQGANPGTSSPIRNWQ